MRRRHQKNENIFFGAGEDRTIDDQINQIKLQPDMLISGSVIEIQLVDCLTRKYT